MKVIVYLIPTILILFSCGNEEEIITDPSSGKIIKKYGYYSDDNGQKIIDGEYVEWYPSGDLKLKEMFEDGKRNGLSIFYQTKDSICYNYYENEVRNGECRLENSKGIVLSTYNYKDGLLNGKSLYNFSNGKKQIESEYENGIPTGLWRYFNLDGNEIAKIEFNTGIPKQIIGKWEVEGMRLTSYEFKEDGTISVFEPYNKFANTPFESMKGYYSMGRLLNLKFGAGNMTRGISFEIESLSKSMLTLRATHTGELWVLKK